MSETRRSNKFRKGNVRVALVVVLFAWALPATAAPIFVISDMHMGVGRNAQYKWDPFEDFRWRDDFDRFLEGVQQLSRDGATLVLNGDTFELWQSPRWADPEHAASYDCPLIQGHENVGCDEIVALARLEKILGDPDHDAALRGLRKFAEKDGNRVVILPGNHDAALLYSKVRDRLRQVIGDRIEIIESGYWLSDDKKVLVEHGHQMDPLNEMKGWPQPFTSYDSARHLVRPWGESFVILMFDPRERDYPIIDNIGDYGAAIGYLLDGEAHAAGGGTAGVVAKLRKMGGGAGQLLRFMLFSTTRSQLMDVLGETEDSDSDALRAPTTIKPDWDIETIRQNNDQVLLRALIPRDGPQAEALALVGDWAIAEGQGLRDFDPDELRVLCSAEWERERSHSTPGTPLCPAKNVSQQDLRRATQYVLSSPNKVLANYLRKRSQEIFSRENGFEVYVYSHTHQAMRGCSPMPVYGSWRPIVVNTGAWQRTASRQYIEQRLTDVHTQPGGGPATDPFQAFKATPEALAQCYGVVVLDPAHVREPRVVFWTGAKFEWSCPDDRCLLSNRHPCKLDEVESPYEVPSPEAVCR